MIYNQWVTKYSLGLVAILTWLPSATLAVGIGLAGTPVSAPVAQVSSDSSKVTAQKNLSPKTKLCSGMILMCTTNKNNFFYL